MDQIRKSSRAVSAAIAESYGKRKYPKHFASKLTDSDSEKFRNTKLAGICTSKQI